MAAASSSSSPPPHFKYDVFISFRGSDTRRGFLSHLLTALSQKKIDAYVDYKLKQGNEILPALFTAIEESQIALIIFSDDYASSKWCLKELVKITECQKEKGQIVMPIFYNVEPSQVRHQKSSYAEAFTEYENNSENDVDKWRSALKAVADLSGFPSKKFGSEALLIKAVVKRILETLDGLQPTDDLQGLVGIDKPIEDLKSLVLANGSNDVRAMGIWGMGGIGKTTIAGALFLTLRSEYESGYFLANVREQVEKHGMLELRNKLHCILLEEKDLDEAGVPNVALADVLRRLRRKKILVVLDDVINPDQVRELVGGRGQHGWLGLGSRIIVTTRDKHVLRKEADDIYEVEALGSDEALQLLILHAFDGNDIPEGYNDLVVEIIEYAKGVPLALKVLGSFLYGKSVEEWRSQLDKLKKMPFEGIQKVLRLSYDGLDRHDQKMLLYIACFFTQRQVRIGQHDFQFRIREHDFQDSVKMLLDACGFSTTIALTTLQDRCLISRRHSWGEYEVHDLIRQMCEEIVREQNIEKPGERHHLWDPNDIYYVLKYDKGTDSIESISLDISKINDLNLSTYSFARMVNLRFLTMRGFKKNSVLARKDPIILLPNNLRLLHWDFCPFKSLQPAGLENLVELRIHRSNLRKIWDGTQNLPNLRKVYLGNSKQLKEVPDLSKALRLEELNLESCKNLVSVHPSIFSLQNLVELNMSNCKRLKRLSDMSKASSLQELLSLASCKNLVSVHPSVFSLPKLVKLDMTNCKWLKRLPDMSKASSLIILNLESCENLVSVHPSVFSLPYLVNLNMKNCKRLKRLSDMSQASRLKELNLESCENLVSVHPSVFSLPNLVKLNMSKCKALKRLPDMSNALRLQELTLKSCENLVSVHPSVFSLPELVKLDMSYCKRFVSVSDIGVLDEEASASGPASPSALSSCSSLQVLDLTGCVSLKHLPDTFYKLTSLQELYLEGCKELDTSNLHILFDGLSSLTYLVMAGCDKLYEVPDNITNLSLLEWLSLDETNVKSMPESIKHLPHLKCLGLWNCKKLQSLPQIPPSLDVLYVRNKIIRCRSDYNKFSE